MSLKGNLASVNLTEIFQMLSLSGREGTLFIYEGPRKRAICFTKDGVSIRSRERNESNLIGKILVRLGKVEEGNLQQAIEERRSSQKLLGDVMVDMGVCSREDVELAFRIQCEEDIQDLFLNRSDAQFEYVDGYFPETDGPYVNLNVNSLLIEIARRTDEWEYIRRRIRGPREIYRFTGVEGSVDADVLTECYSHRIDPFIDGTHAVGEIMDLSYVNKFEVCKLLASYLDAGIIELVPADAIRLNARLALRMGDPDSAIRHYEYLMSTGDYPLEVMGEAAEAHEATRDFAEAAALLRRLAEEQVRGGDVRGAIDSLRRVANYPRPEPEALRYLLELVFENPRDAAEFGAHIVEAGKTLVAYRIKHEQRREAMELLEQLIAGFPEEVAFPVSLVNLYYEDGKVEKAARDCERYAKEFLKRRKATQAVSLYKKLLIIDPQRNDIRDRIRKLVTGKRRRSGAGAVPRLAIALAVTLLVGGAAVVLLQNNGSLVSGGDSTPDVTMLRLLANAREERGQAEQQCSELIEGYRKLHKSLDKGALENRDELRTHLDNAHKNYRLFSKHAEKVHQIVETIRGETRKEQVLAQVRSIVSAIENREAEVRSERGRWGAKAQAAAERLYQEGVDEYNVARLRSALEKFTLSRDLATRRDWTIDVKLDQYVNNISADVTRVKEQLAAARELEEKREWIQARRLDFDLLREFRNADLVHEMRVPWEILTVPPGATVVVNGVEMGQRTPTIVRLSPFEETTITLRKANFLEKSYRVNPVADEEAPDPARYTFTWSLPRAATWEHNIGDHIESSPAAWGGRVAFAGRNGRWYVYESETGRQVATDKPKTFDGSSAGLVADGDCFFVPTLDGKIFAYDADTSKLRYALTDFDAGIYARPVIADGRLYAADHAGNVSAHDLKTRKRIWHEATSHGVRATPVVQGDHLVVVSASGDVSVLLRSSGKLVKQYRLKGAFSSAPAVIGSDDLIFPTEEGVLYGVDRVTGDVRWERDLGAMIRSTPEVRGRVAFVAPRAGELVAIDTKTGDVINRYTRLNSSTRSPVASTDRMFFANGPVLSAFASKEEGGYGLAWSFKAKGQILSGPQVAGDGVFIGDDKGNVYRLEAND